MPSTATVAMQRRDLVIAVTIGLAIFRDTLVPRPRIATRYLEPASAGLLLFAAVHLA